MVPILTSDNNTSMYHGTNTGDGRRRYWRFDWKADELTDPFYQIIITYNSMAAGPSLISSLSKNDQHFVLTICFFGL